jgi:pimeloyl-ACP methyl ester carboxylesterase
MASYSEERFDLRGIETVVQIAGEGDPLVFLHGAGTVTGFDALLPLAERFRLIVPFHPGFGPSADDTTVDDIHDYRRHYLDLFDELGLETMALAGHSLGGWLAANFAADHTERVTRLVLAAPFGMRDEEHPTTDFLAIPGDQLGPYLTADLSVFEGHMPMPPTPEFLADRYR